MEYRSEEELATLAHASGVRLLSFRRFLASIDIGRRQAFNLRFGGLFNACFLELRGGGIRTNSCCGCEGALWASGMYVLCVCVCMCACVRAAKFLLLLAVSPLVADDSQCCLWFDIAASHYFQLLIAFVFFGNGTWPPHLDLGFERKGVLTAGGGGKYWGGCVFPPCFRLLMLARFPSFLSSPICVK
jgi:hypothetical protein